MCPEGRKVLLMGSSKYRAEKLPPEVKERFDAAIESGVTFIVAQANGACRHTVKKILTSKITIHFCIRGLLR